MKMIDLPTDASHLFNTEVLGLQLYLERLVVAITLLLLFLSILRRGEKSIFDRS